MNRECDKVYQRLENTSWIQFDCNGKKNDIKQKVILKKLERLKLLLHDFQKAMYEIYIQ